MTDAAGATLSTLPTTRRALLSALKKRGELRAEELAAELGVTVSAVRQHLRGLAADDLVTHAQVRSGPGRPKHVYRLTDTGELLFPRAYGELTNELLAYVQDESPELVERVFDRRRARRVAAAQQRLAGRPLAEQVAELTRILDEDGYLAELVHQPDGSYRIVEHNCAILAVARRYGTACSTELDFIRTVLPAADVERVTHILAGGHTCAYEIRPRSRPGGGRGRRRQQGQVTATA